MHQQQTAFENIVEKEEIARNEQFLLCPQCFLLNQVILSLFVHIFDIISLSAAELGEPKIGISGKGLNKFYFKHLRNYPSSFDTISQKGSCHHLFQKVVLDFQSKVKFAMATKLLNTENL